MNNDVDYNKYMKSPEWAKKRKERLELDGYKCQMCGTTEKLEVHHIKYDTLGNENMDDLITLCEHCHTKVHSAKSLSWCFKHNRFPNKGIEKWVKGKKRRKAKRERAKAKEEKKKLLDVEYHD